jgi:hypothetical protein
MLRGRAPILPAAWKRRAGSNYRKRNTMAAMKITTKMMMP